MQFNQPLVEGTFKSRSKRFVAEVELHTGEAVSAHLANRGSMMGCLEPGSKVLMSVSEDPRRKFKHQLEIVYDHRGRMLTHQLIPLERGRSVEPVPRPETGAPSQSELERSWRKRSTYSVRSE